LVHCGRSFSGGPTFLAHFARTRLRVRPFPRDRASLSPPCRPSSVSKTLGAYLRIAERGPWHALPKSAPSFGGVQAALRVLCCVPTRRRPFGFTMNKPGRSKRLPFFRSDVKAWPIKGSILNRISVVETLYWPSRSNFGFSTVPPPLDAREAMDWLRRSRPSLPLSAVSNDGMAIGA
jgi:hypothetical protein